MFKFLILLFLMGCTSLFYHPDRVQYVKPENYNFAYREVTFHPKDGTELIGWFFPAKTPAPKGTIIHFHGNAQNISAHFLNLSWVMDRGYNLFVFDYRGYGISDGKPTPDGVYQDSLAALAEGRKLWAENGKGKFVVYGQSLGGAVAMRALEDFPELDHVDLVVQDGTFMSYQDVAFHKLSRSLLLPLSPLAYVLVSDEYATERFVRKLARPTLVIVGESDKVVNKKFGHEIFDSLITPQKWLWKIPKGEHISTFHDPKARYRDDFIKLLEELH
jgi:uncharacterized protein